jgi:hypothetical protein
MSATRFRNGEREFPAKVGIGPTFPAARVSVSFGGFNGPQPPISNILEFEVDLI